MPPRLIEKLILPELDLSKMHPPNHKIFTSQRNDLIWRETRNCFRIDSIFSGQMQKSNFRASFKNAVSCNRWGRKVFICAYWAETTTLYNIYVLWRCVIFTTTLRVITANFSNGHKRALLPDTRSLTHHELANRLHFMDEILPLKSIICRLLF